MKKLRRRCECCGNIFEVNKDIFWTECPYAAEIANDNTKMWHCDNCDYECGMDI